MGAAAQPELPLLRPTLPGYAPGIVDDDPWTLQCGDCGATTSGLRAARLVMSSGFHFHTCGGRVGDRVRRCPDCLARAKAACPVGRCRR